VIANRDARQRAPSTFYQVKSRNDIARVSHANGATGAHEK
jgi:hypothetical protein